MGNTKLTFERYEKKYLLSREKVEALRREMDAHLVPDEYFQSTVCSIYYDTDDFRLIRHSLDAPVYKEKLRLRSYNVPTEDGIVFLELKKKYKGVVYKRRVPLRAAEAEDYLSGRSHPEKDGQVLREIDWFLKMNPVKPRAFIACDRSAYVAKDDRELRITFDENMRWRESDLTITHGSEGEPLVKPGEVLMEIKFPEAAPLWLAELLSRLTVFPTSFSKYGISYKNYLIQEYLNGVNCCV